MEDRVGNIPQLVRGTSWGNSFCMQMNKGLETANAKRAQMHDQGIKVEYLTPLEKSRQDPKSMRKAINAHCFVCMGSGVHGWKVEIANCTSEDICPLWHLRPFQNTSYVRSDD